MSNISAEAPAEVILRRAEVEQRTGLKRSTIYRYVALGAFPKPVPLGTRNVGWLESDVQQWVQSVAGRTGKRQRGDEPRTSPAEDDTTDLGIAYRIRRSYGRTARCCNANARLTLRELERLKAAAAMQGKALGEWTRDVLLREGSQANAERALFTELTALRLLMTNVLRPLALGATLKPEEFQAILAGVRTDKHDAARDLLAQYQPGEREEQ